MADDLCERCGRATSVCLAAPYGDAKLVLECREAELELTQRKLAATRAQLAYAQSLLVKCREALDLAIEETTVEGEGG